MKWRWTGMALLAGSWLFGLGGYHQPQWLAWALLLAAGTACLLPGDEPRPAGRVWQLAALLLLVPSARALPWPFRAMPLVLAAGLLLGALPIPRRWPARAAAALTTAGSILLIQAAGLLAYQALTARSHELPAPLAAGLARLARLLSIPAAWNGAEIALYTIRKVHPLAATWELFLDPATLGFLLGGLGAVLLSRRMPNGHAVRLLVCVLAWLPLRAGVLMAIWMHRALLTDYDAPLHLMGTFWNGWLMLLLLAPPVGLACRCLVPAEPAPRRFGPPPAADPYRAPKGVLSAVAILLAGALLTAGICWDPPGRRKAGRVIVDEFHSTWEPTDRPFDTEWYGHEAGYNYSCIYDYCSRFYDMSRLRTNLTGAALAACDVLMLKVPTSPYTGEELATVRRFVAEGGGLMLVGEHTDVFLTTTHLNQMAREFGFEFRRDCLFGIDTGFEQLYCPPWVPHPIVQHMPPLELAVSCSIAPRSDTGRAVMRAAGLWNLPADYHASNFYPQKEERADMRYGAFVQLWATRHGAGRVVAFTDSTIFSNFSAFEPGKSELMLGMLEWLNRANRGGDPRRWLVAGGILLALAGLGLARARVPPVALVAAGLLGCTLAGGLIRRHHRAAMPMPGRRRPLTMLVVDRTVSDATLSRSGFIRATAKSFGIFEQWFLRLGYFLSRRSGESAFSGDLLVFLQPNRPPQDAFREKLARYVESGGKVLIVDSANNGASSANSLLHPFQMSFETHTAVEGDLQPPEGWPVVPVSAAWTVAGGQPFLFVNHQPVAAAARFGKGLVVALGCGARFNDENMGITPDVPPQDDVRQVYELEFRLLRAIVEDALAGRD
ncbi:MAG: hypothetical protein JXR37_15730 [Kiritimatiellae bacterium]|nr:hypothetical protein [Kiritimatiellia bacterium]